MKRFYNVVSAIICCAKEARASIVLDIDNLQFVLQNCERLPNYRFKSCKKRQILSEVCMIKKKTAPHSTFYLRRDEKKYV